MPSVALIPDLMEFRTMNSFFVLLSMVLGLDTFPESYIIGASRKNPVHSMAM